MVEWRTATPISLGAALFFGLLVVDIYGGSVNGLQTSYERFLSHTSSERRMLLSKQDAASKALQEPSNLEASARSGASRSLQTQISQHEDPSQPATSSTGAHTYNGVKLGRNVLSATTQPVLAKPADTKPPPQKGVSSTSHIPQADTSSAKMPTKEGPTFVLQNIFRRSMLTEEGVWTEKMAQQHMANMGTGMTGKARNLLDQVYVSEENPTTFGSDIWLEKKAQQDSANRGTGVTAKSRNLLDQVYVVKENPIGSEPNVTAKSRNLLDQVYVVKANPIGSEPNMTAKSRNLLDQVYVVKEEPIGSESDIWVEKKAQQDSANRGTGVTAKSRNLLDQVYVVKENPIVSGSNVTAKSRNLLDQVYVVKETPIGSGSNVTGKSRNLLDQVYVVKEEPIISEKQLSNDLVSDANGGSSSTANRRHLLSTDAASIWEQKQAEQSKADRAMFTTSTARNLLAAPANHTTKRHAQIPCFSQWTTRLQPGGSGGLVNVTLVSPSQLLFSFNASVGYYPSSAALVLKDAGTKAKPVGVALNMAGKATSARNASLSSGDTTSAAAFQRLVAHLGNGSAVLAVSLKPTASSKMTKTLALNGTLQAKCPLSQGSNHTGAYQNSYLACTYPGYTSSFTIPRGVNVTTRLLQACSAAPESVAVATALSAQDLFPGWSPGSSICVPKGCPQSLAKPTPPTQPARSLGYGTARPYGSHSPRSSPGGGYGSVYAGIYGQPVKAPAASTSTKHTGKPGHTQPAPPGSRGMVNKTAATGGHSKAGLSKAPSAVPPATGRLHKAHGSAKAHAPAHAPAHSPAPSPSRLHKPAHGSSVHKTAASNPPAKSKSSGGFFTNMFSYQAGTAKAPSPRVSRARTLSDAPAPSIWKTVEGTLKGAAEEVIHPMKSAASKMAQPPADLLPALEEDPYTHVDKATNTTPGPAPIESVTAGVSQTVNTTLAEPRTNLEATARPVNGTLDCTSKGFNKVYQVPSNCSRNMPDLLRQECGVSPESVAFASAQKWTSNFRVFKPGSSICVPADCNPCGSAAVAPAASLPHLAANSTRHVVTSYNSQGFPEPSNTTAAGTPLPANISIISFATAAAG